MDVRVKCYGAVRDAVGASTVTVAVPERARVGDALDRLGVRGADAGGECDVESTDEGDSDAERIGDGRRLVVRRDGTHVDLDARLEDGDVLAVSESPMPD